MIRIESTWDSELASSYYEKHRMLSDELQDAIEDRDSAKFTRVAKEIVRSRARFDRYVSRRLREDGHF